MTKKEYLDQIADLRVNETKLKKIHETYSDQLPDDLEKIISNCDETVFFDDGTRILSYAEILDAERDLHIEFRDKGLIPISDCGDNDFIVYDFINKIWAKFNIVDETVFKKRASLDDLLR